MRKKKLTVEEQIEHMKNESGIQFNIVGEDYAQEFLEINNYYFKLKSYSKNYDKYRQGENKGKYINLEFAYLVELSTLDMYLRKFIIGMALDIEHALITQLIRDVGENKVENGYDIIDDLFIRYSYMEENILRQRKHSATGDLISKCEGKFAIWNVVEVLSFADIIKLYEFYYKKYPTEGSMENYLWSIRFLRNAAAHNNCLLNSLKNPYSVEIQPNRDMNTFISRIPGINTNSRTKKMRNPVVHDFVVMLYVFNNVVLSEGIKKYNMKELKDLIDIRMIRNKHYFKKNQIITSYYEFIKIIVDFFYNLSV